MSRPADCASPHGRIVNGDFAGRRIEFNHLTLEGVADRVVFMDEGRVVEDGPPEQILRPPETERPERFRDLLVHI